MDKFGGDAAGTHRFDLHNSARKSESEKIVNNKGPDKLIKRHGRSDRALDHLIQCFKVATEHPLAIAECGFPVFRESS